MTYFYEDEVQKLGKQYFMYLNIVGNYVKM